MEQEKQDRPAPLISVVIATFNRAEMLGDALASLAKQTLSSDQFEVLIVDNNSTDHTRKMTERFMKSFPNFRYVREATQGASAARNRGWREARADYVAFADDDALMPPHWLALAKDIIEKHEPTGLGGPFYPFYISEKPYWFKDQYGSWLGMEQEGTLPAKQYLSGMNMIFQRRVLQEVGGFTNSLGPCGGKVGYGEEPTLQMRIRGNEPDSVIYFHPDLFVYHLVAPFRTTLWGGCKDKFITGRYSVRVFWNQQSAPTSKKILLLRLIKTCKAMLLDFCFGLVRRDRTKQPYCKQVIYEIMAVHVPYLGILWEKWRLISGASQ